MDKRGERMTDLTAFSNYEEYKKTLTEELTKASESFVRIGYLLKVARDTAILAGTAYSDVNEFAAAEYNLDKTQVSRFIRINDRFSEGGNSDRLQESFRGIGYAKLSMMLLLPDSLNEEITPAFSKTEVQALKEEVQAEAAVTPIERILEGGQPEMEDMSLLEKAVYELLRTKPELYREIWEVITGGYEQGADDHLYKMLQEILAPAGEAIHSVRIRGIGRIAISIKGTDRNIMLVNLRTDEKDPWSWEDLYNAAVIFTGPREEGPEASYEKAFREPWPEEKKPEVAPVQPQKKESKVTKAAPDKKPKPVKPKIEPVKKEPEPTEPKEADSGSETAVEPDIQGAVEKTVKSTEAAVEAWKNMAQSADAAAADIHAGTSTPPNPAPLEFPEDPEGCEGQTDFNDIPEILPTPAYELSGNAREWIGMWIHNLKADLTAMAEQEHVTPAELIRAAVPVIREELEKMEA